MTLVYPDPQIERGVLSPYIIYDNIIMNCDLARGFHIDGFEGSTWPYCIQRVWTHSRDLENWDADICFDYQR